MQYAVSIAARWVHTVALALWLGGLIAIGALVAPSAFQVVHVNPTFAGNATLQTAVAGGIVGSSLHKFNVLCDLCGVLMLLTGGVLLGVGRLGRHGRLWTIVGMVLALIVLAMTLYLGFSLFPAMTLAQSQNNTPVFEALHHRYERISVLELAPLLLLVLATAVRDTDMAGLRSKAEGAVRIE